MEKLKKRNQDRQRMDTEKSTNNEKHIPITVNNKRTCTYRVNTSVNLYIDYILLPINIDYIFHPEPPAKPIYI